MQVFGIPFADNVFGLPTELFAAGVGILGVTGMWPGGKGNAIAQMASYASLGIAAIIFAAKQGMIPSQSDYTRGHRSMLASHMTR